MQQGWDLRGALRGLALRAGLRPNKCPQRGADGFIFSCRRGSCSSAFFSERRESRQHAVGVSGELSEGRRRAGRGTAPPRGRTQACEPAALAAGREGASLSTDAATSKGSCEDGHRLTQGTKGRRQVPHISWVPPTENIGLRMGRRGSCLLQSALGQGPHTGGARVSLDPLSLFLPTQQGPSGASLWSNALCWVWPALRHPCTQEVAGLTSVPPLESSGWLLAP